MAGIRDSVHSRITAFSALLSHKSRTTLSAPWWYGRARAFAAHKALNAVILRVDASRIPAIAALPNVVSIRPVVNYKLDLSETVPTSARRLCRPPDSMVRGVTVAVIDTGIDYTHKEFGGPGTRALILPLTAQARTM